MKLTGFSFRWVSIAGGAHLAIGSRSECQDVPSLGGASGIWAQRGVTIINAVPTLINIMTSLDSECPLPPSVRLLNLGGEACPLALVNRLWSPDMHIINTYGPSETTVSATYQKLFPDQQVTIGRPLPMYHAMLLPILDEPPKTWSAIELEEGAEGELAIGGPCLGKGYVQRPELTREKFIDHPQPSFNGERLYRTGDHVRLDANFNIIFLGRIDTQVKHRGFRIELGEIEHAITDHPRVQTGAVILSKATDRLEAYVVVKKGEDVETKELREKLRRLPAYMQPEAFCFIAANEMPRLPSGKINVKALQDLSTDFASQRKEEGEGEDGSSDIPDDGSDLSIILKAMSVVFPQAGNITPTSDFFDDLGGHSLVAAMLVSKLRKDSPNGSALGGLGLQAIYMHRTAKSIAGSIAEVSDSDDSSSKDNTILDAQLGDHWPVSQQKYILCALAQIPFLLFLFFIEGATILGPYLVFDALLREVDLGSAIGITYFTFVMVPILRALIGIVGKWISLGRAKPGEYPLYGVYYYRWWVADHFVRLIDMTTLAETPLMPALLRMLGCNVGYHCHIGVATYTSPAFDLVSIGDDVTIGEEVALVTSWVERGRLILAPVTIGSQTHIGSNALLEGHSTIAEGGELGPMSMLPQGAHVPVGERWVGSPARFKAVSENVGDMKNSRPSEIRVFTMTMALAFSSIFLLPVIVFAPQIPSLLLFDYVKITSSWWISTAIVCVPAAIIYIILVFIELIVLRWVILGKVVECSFRTTSFYFWRKWFIDRLMGISLVVLAPVYASLYVVPFLRSLGVKIGHRAEVSNARGLNFELTEIGEESFVADRVLMGSAEIRNHTVTMKKTKLHERAFLGNGAIMPQGTEMASNTLVGVLSLAPEKPLKEGESCFGSPAILMPARQRGTVDQPDNLLYSPSWKQIALRLFVEGMRIIVPRVLIVFGLGFGLQVQETAFKYIGAWPLVLMLPLFYLFCKFPRIFLSCNHKPNTPQSSPSPPSPSQHSLNGFSSAATNAPNGPSGASTSGNPNSSPPSTKTLAPPFSPTNSPAPPSPAGLSSSSASKSGPAQRCSGTTLRNSIW